MPPASPVHNSSNSTGKIMKGFFECSKSLMDAKSQLESKAIKRFGTIYEVIRLVRVWRLCTLHVKDPKIQVAFFEVDFVIHNMKSHHAHFRQCHSSETTLQIGCRRSYHPPHCWHRLLQQRSLEVAQSLG